MADTGKLFDLITAGQVDGLRQLLEQDPALSTACNDAGIPAIMMALYYRRYEMVELIRRACGDLNIFMAAALGDEQRLQALVDSGSAVDSRSADGFAPLHLAAFFGRTGAVRLLLGAGANVNAVAGNASRVQPLHSAVACGSHEIVELLLQAGAGPDAVQHGGWTPLQAASKHGNSAIVAALVSYGADPALASDDGHSALDLAANEGILELLQGGGHKR